MEEQLALAVVWRDKQYHISKLLLRLNDPDLLTKNLQRVFEISDVVNNSNCTTVLSSNLEGENGPLNVEWADGRLSRYPTEWLEKHLPKSTDASSAQTSTTPLADLHLWDASFMHFVPRMAHAEVVGSADGKLRLAASLARYGLALVHSCPTELNEVERFGNAVGYVRNTNYGSVFDVVDKGSTGNSLAQTCVGIRQHTDNPYRDPFPGVQLLHCLASSAVGGATTFTDGFAAAEALRRNHPEEFTLLTQHAHPFEYRDPEDGVVLRTSVPVISLGSDGHITRIAFNNRSAGCIDLPADLFERYYAAWSRFDEICNSAEFLIEILMKPGDLTIFVNSRAMHGRREYTPGAGRHIQGCYIDHDALFSRVHWAQHQSGGSVPNSHEGVGACDVHWRAMEDSMAALATQAEFKYGEGVDMLQHGLQAAWVAAEQGAARDTVLAALMHDVGNSPQARKAWEAAGNPNVQLFVSSSDQSIGYELHAEVGASYLRGLGFSEEVASAVGLHVEAKRALVAAEPAYIQELSAASVETLRLQGGPLSAAELEAFNSQAGAAVALCLRRFDDKSKQAGRDVPQLDHYRSVIYEHLLARSVAK